MTVDCVQNPAPKRIPRRVWITVVAFLLIYFAVELSVAARKGLSFDEGEEITVGYDLWLQRDFRMEAANGDLVKRWAALPLLLAHPVFPGTGDRFWRLGGPYGLAHEFCFELGNPIDSLLFQARAMVALLGVATGIVIFFASRALFGDWGGVVSLGLFAFNPHMLAFGAIVSTDMSICLALLGSTACIWALLHRVTWTRLVGSLVVFGLLLLAKLSSLIVFPVTAVLILVKLISGRPMVWALGRPRIVASSIGQARIILVLIAVHALAGWAAIWAHYDFRYSASPKPEDTGIVMRKIPDETVVNPMIVRFIDWSRKSHFLPEGYLHGVEWLLHRNESRIAFMDGRWDFGGWRMFFIRAMWLKGSPGFLLLLGLGIACWWRLHKRLNYNVIPLIALIMIYLGAACIQHLDIGYRHILPIYPPLFVLAGSVANARFFRSRWPSALAGALLLWYAADSAAVYPNYLAYFNPLAGGPANGYKHLVDSSVDWGMDLPGLKRWLDRHNPEGEPVYLAYFGTDSPAYRGIRCQQMPGFFDWRPPLKPYFLKPGIYAISATLYESVYTNPLGPWRTAYEAAYQNALRNLVTLDSTADQPALRADLLKRYPEKFWDEEYAAFERLRFGRLCAWLRHNAAPLDNVGHSILIWRLSQESLQSALFGLPPEIDDQFKIPGP